MSDPYIFYSKLIKEADAFEYYTEHADLIRNVYNKKDYFEKLKKSKYNHLKNDDIIKLLIIKDYYTYTCFSPKEEDVDFYKSYNINYKWLIWNKNWKDIENDIKSYCHFLNEDLLKILLNNIFTQSLMYFEIEIFKELLKYLEVENRKTKFLISTDTIKDEVTLIEKRLLERQTNQSRKKPNNFEESYLELKELNDILIKYNISNFKSLKSLLKKALSVDIDKYYLTIIIRTLTGDKQENYQAIYPIIRKLVPHRDKYNQRDNKYWFKNENEFLGFKHYKGIGYYDWQEYCKMKLKNFIKKYKIIKID